MLRKEIPKWTVGVLALLSLLAAAPPAGAVSQVAGAAEAAGSGLVSLVPSSGVGAEVARSSPKVLEVLQRDLHLSRDEAITRIGRQHAAIAVEARARVAAGRHFAGSWLNDDGSALMVAVTDQRVAPAVRAAGATPTLVTYRRGQLEAAGQTLADRLAKDPNPVVHGWYVDPRRNRLVVDFAAGKHGAAAAWIAAAGVPAGLVAYDTSAGPIKLRADYLPGDGYRARLSCTAGFGVKLLNPLFPLPFNGFVTAGHCVNLNSFLSLKLQPIPFPRDAFAVESSFPPRTTRIQDRAVAQLSDADTQILPVVRTVDFANVGISVLGSQAAAVGAMVCFYGDSSKFQCGTLTARGLTASSPDAPGVTIIGLNKMTGCVQDGDSGGPVITQAGQAQGTIVGDNCENPNSDRSSFYQPINQTLTDFRLRLLLAGGSPLPAPPRISALFCEAFDDYYGAWFYCDLYWDGGTDPDEVSVSSNGDQARRFNDFDENYVSLSGRCNPYQDTYVSVSVFDASGRRADGNVSAFCPR